MEKGPSESGDRVFRLNYQPHRGPSMVVVRGQSGPPRVHKEKVMQRKALDRLVSWIGLSLAALVVGAGALLSWAPTFVGNEVHSQLSAQQIYFPAKNSPAIAAPEHQAVRKYAGQQLTSGAQVKAYADRFIANHLKEIGGGKTYAQLSAQAQADPADTKL